MVTTALDDAKRNNRLFCSKPIEPEYSSVNATSTSAASETISEQGAFTIGRPKGVCVSCGSNKPHDFKRCKAKSFNCYKCGQRGHFSRVCRFQGKSSSGFNTGKSDNDNSAAVKEASYSLCVMGAAGNLANSIVFSQVNNRPYKTLLDTGSSRCFVSKVAASNFKIKGLTSVFSVGMARSKNKVDVTKFCYVDLVMFDVSYKRVKLYVMENLCVEILLGRDFLELHKSVIFKFNGNRDNLVVPVGIVGAWKLKIG